MANRSLEELKVLNKLDIVDFRHLTKDKIIEFVSGIPEMSEETAMAIISQFPELAKRASDTVLSIKTACTDIINHGSKSQTDTIQSYQKVIDAINDQLNNPDLSYEQRLELSEKMTEICKEIDKSGKDHKEWLGKVFVESTAAIGTVFAITVMALSGGKLKLK